MSEIAEVQRSARRHWAAPEGQHDSVVLWARRILPAGIGALAAFLMFAPLANPNGDVSFVLAKDTVAFARERLKVVAATYRGEDSKGRPFSLTAGSAVQKSSRDPVVRLKDLSAQIELADGPAMLVAANARYDMDREVVAVDGPLTFTSADGYSLSTRDVAVGLKTRQLVSGGAVEGRLPIGSFSAGRMRADLNARTVTLEGRARLRIVQGAGR
jgi:lipopolysaccharide export system protein LptC